MDILIEECAKINADFNEYVEEAVALNDYYIEARYPTDFREDVGFDEAREALEMAGRIREFVKSKIA